MTTVPGSIGVDSAGDDDPVGAGPDSSSEADEGPSGSSASDGSLTEGCAVDSDEASSSEDRRVFELVGVGFSGGDSAGSSADSPRRLRRRRSPAMGRRSVEGT